MAQLDVPAEPSGPLSHLLFRRLQHLPDDYYPRPITDQNRLHLLNGYTVDGAVSAAHQVHAEQVREVDTPGVVGIVEASDGVVAGQRTLRPQRTPTPSVGVVVSTNRGASRPKAQALDDGQYLNQVFIE